MKTITGNHNWLNYREQEDHGIQSQLIAQFLYLSGQKACKSQRNGKFTLRFHFLAVQSGYNHIVSLTCVPDFFFSVINQLPNREVETS